MLKYHIEFQWYTEYGFDIPDCQNVHPAKRQPTQQRNRMEMSLDAEIVPASHGRAFRMKAGECVLITNTHGNQVVDAWALSASDPFETSSLDHTRSINSNIFFVSGMSLASNRRRPMLTMVADSAGVRHDTLLCPCSSELYAQLGCEEHHRSCTDNFHEALSEIGMDVPFTPASLNLFMNVPVAEGGTVDRVPPSTSPGDHVVLRAEMDLILVLSACPQDITPINGAARMPKDVSVRIVDSFPAGDAS
ncbi:urea carboxylase-associated family protein [Rhizobium sp. NRK18]|uniref:urea carboxylase-associated family protein n=1 Tax=Rhizobium sp. NRK18 TaxID=2964667 RepID=UPI0021C37EC0|nr:urea carboxylase-associated family protein [Rhizobium sp. NRK18]MCQ2006378.1 urea carboxylase-associated family protein [Rhizobium sp. NRK18]